MAEEVVPEQDRGNEVGGVDSMHDETWANMVADVIAEITQDPARRDALQYELMARDGYRIAMMQHRAGASDRVCRELLKRELMEMLGE